MKAIIELVAIQEQPLSDAEQDISPEQRDAIEATERAKTERLSLERLGLKPGTVLTFTKDPTITCTVAGPKTVLFKGVEGSVSANLPEPAMHPTGRLMAKSENPFRWFDSSPAVIQLVVMLYVRYPLSLRNVEDLAFERGIDVCHETVRKWVNRLGPMFAAKIRKRRVHAMRQHTHWRWHLDEVYVRVQGEMRYLWRAVDHEGEVLESFVTKTRDKAAALKFMKKLMKRHGCAKAITTDGLRSYKAAMKELNVADRQEVGRWANNRAENSHQPFRRRERVMLRFRRMKTLQQFVSTHAAFHNHFNQERNLVSREIYRERRSAALAECKPSRPKPRRPCPHRANWRQVLVGLTAPS